MLRRRVFDLAGLFSRVISVESGGISYLVSTSDRSIGRELFAWRSFEDDIMDRAMGLLREEAGEPPLAGKIFIDVGANIGTSTIPALLRFGAASAIAFEPDERCFRLLQHNLLGNDVTSRVHIERSAVWDEPGVADFELGDSNWGDGRVRSGHGSVPGFFEEEKRTTTPVPLTTLDAFIVKHDIDLGRVGLLWVDAQGAEFHVLNGARSLLSSGIPVVMEYWPYGLSRSGGLTELSSLIAEHYTAIVDLRFAAESTELQPIPAEGIETVRRRCTGVRYTDLLLLR